MRSIRADPRRHPRASLYGRAASNCRCALKRLGALLAPSAPAAPRAPGPREALPRAEVGHSNPLPVLSRVSTFDLCMCLSQCGDAVAMVGAHVGPAAPARPDPRAPPRPAPARVLVGGAGGAPADRASADGDWGRPGEGARQRLLFATGLRGLARARGGAEREPRTGRGGTGPRDIKFLLCRPPIPAASAVRALCFADSSNRRRAAVGLLCTDGYVRVFDVLARLSNVFGEVVEGEPSLVFQACIVPRPAAPPALPPSASPPSPPSPPSGPSGPSGSEARGPARRRRLLLRAGPRPAGLAAGSPAASPPPTATAAATACAARRPSPTAAASAAASAPPRRPRPLRRPRRRRRGRARRSDNARALALFLACVCFILLHGLASPHRQPLDNAIEALFLLVLTLTSCMEMATSAALARPDYDVRAVQYAFHGAGLLVGGGLIAAYYTRFFRLRGLGLRALNSVPVAPQPPAPAPAPEPSGLQPASALAGRGWGESGSARWRARSLSLQGAPGPSVLLLDAGSEPGTPRARSGSQAGLLAPADREREGAHGAGAGGALPILRTLWRFTEPPSAPASGAALASGPPPNSSSRRPRAAARLLARLRRPRPRPRPPRP
eukprot:tig00020904_g15173.t1